ncbi:hypothetical protein [Pseudodesulfovibrio senegalensis]|uniref:Uncharacterized protein n=1 Tax=Pseudodesulfovibrio senegalensis TaxID=1721087 RepID=A0A6N6N558_9BACT|nr:hypothetical protein [Pseudodesulfovibrio senegalensis]KAB1442364.1 hypothetical protein F8A88_07920 [Pseudodesulfovibrio senegalensis]
MKTGRIVLVTFVIMCCLASAALADTSNVLADKQKVKTFLTADKDKKTSFYTAKWGDTFKNCRGNDVSVKVVAAAVRQSASSYSYVWRDIYTRTSQTDLMVELYIDSKKVLLVENPERTGIAFDHILPGGESLEVVVDGSEYSTSMTFDVRVVSDAPSLESMCGL